MQTIPHGTQDGGGPIFLSWKRTENSIGIRKGEGDVNPSPYWRMPIRRMADICIYIQFAAAIILRVIRGRNLKPGLDGLTAVTFNPYKISILPERVPWLKVS